MASGNVNKNPREKMITTVSDAGDTRIMMFQVAGATKSKARGIRRLDHEQRPPNSLGRRGRRRRGLHIQRKAAGRKARLRKKGSVLDMRMNIMAPREGGPSHDEGKEDTRALGELGSTRQEED